MAVIMPNGTYVLLRRNPRPEVEDAHGVPVPALLSSSVPTPAFAASVREVGDGSWSFRLPPELWPVHVDDVISLPGSGQWVIRSVKLSANSVESALDYVGGLCEPNPDPRR